MAVYKIATIGNTNDTKYFEYAKEYLGQSSENDSVDIEFIDISGKTADELLDFGPFYAVMYSTDIHETTNANTLKDFLNIPENPEDLVVCAISHDGITTKDAELEQEQIQQYLPPDKEAPSVSPINVNSQKEMENCCDIIIKPNISQYLNIANSLEDSTNSKTNKIVDFVMNTTKQKHEYTAGHVDRVSKYVGEIANELDFSPEEKQEAVLSALLHDIGKIGIPDKVLASDKALTFNERVQMEYHTILGSKLLDCAINHNEELKEIITPEVLKGIKNHHKDYDGMHFKKPGEEPDKLRGDDIGKYALVIQVADCMDAMTSQRAYNIPKNVVDTFRDICSNKGKQFKPEVVDAALISFGKQLASIGYDPEKLIPENSQPWNEKVDSELRTFFQTNSDKFQINKDSKPGEYCDLGFRLDKNGYFEFDGKNPPNRNMDICKESEYTFQEGKFARDNHIDQETLSQETREHIMDGVIKKFEEKDNEGHEAMLRACVSEKNKQHLLGEEVVEASIVDSDYNRGNYNEVTHTITQNTQQTINNKSKDER